MSRGNWSFPIGDGICVDHENGRWSDGAFFDEEDVPIEWHQASHYLLAHGNASAMAPLPVPENRLRTAHPSKALTMLSHSASSESRQTGLPARLYQ